MRANTPNRAPPLPSTTDLWRARVAAWRHSGKTAEKFCEGEPFEASTLLWWSSRLRHAPGPAFIELRPRRPVASDAPAGLVVEIGAARVTVPPSCDPSLLSALVAALAGAAR